MLVSFLNPHGMMEYEFFKLKNVSIFGRFVDVFLHFAAHCSETVLFTMKLIVTTLLPRGTLTTTNEKHSQL